METGIENLYYYVDKSKLYSAWRKYYEKMGLSYTKMTKKVFERVAKGRFPSVEQLTASTKPKR